MKLSDPVAACRGIGPKTARRLEDAGIRTVLDILRFYPAGYDMAEHITDVASLKLGQTGAVLCTIKSAPSIFRGKRNVTTISVMAGDGTGVLRIYWFNCPYIKGRLVKGARLVFRGRICLSGGGISMTQPVIYTEEEYSSISGRIFPIYLTKGGVGGKTIQRAAAQILKEALPVREFLNDDIRTAYGLIGEWDALSKIHFPDGKKDVEAARRRLIFDEFLLFLLKIRRLKAGMTCDMAPIFHNTDWADRIVNALGFSLTDAQKRVWGQVREDLVSGRAMNRLIQGDVGSGKTAIALLALVTAAENGFQGAFMAPTQILAKQHYEKFERIIKKAGIPCRVVLLTGQTRKSKKADAKDADIVIGTHSIIQAGAEYERLGLVVTDEQHRFGVAQRRSLREKGSGAPHVLVMSATPIPRTLALIIYGDLDISIIDMRPKGRLPIKNCVIRASDRKKALSFVLGQVRLGRQAYIICPLAEKSENVDAKDVVSYYEGLRRGVGDAVSIGLLYGRMPAEKKAAEMEKFKAGLTQILVSTTVVEVGVDVPNATCMMIENAERFGLAQLHQLRGRVGRTDLQSYCIFMDGTGDTDANGRLETIAAENDGFRVAQEDLRLRGSGDLFGFRQSGDMKFKLGDIYGDSVILREAAGLADDIIGEDPNLERHEGLRVILDSEAARLI